MKYQVKRLQAKVESTGATDGCSEGWCVARLDTAVETFTKL
jgi:hypothetical protein